jgi:arylsulfatase A-like enzyme
MTDRTELDKDIILITVDSLRYDYLFDGSSVSDSFPNLKSLSQAGTTFSNAFSNAGYTKSSFLSVFSGTFPWMFESVRGGFGPDRPHVAELFAEAGYLTGGFHSNPYLSATYGYDRGFDHYMGRDTESDINETTLSSDVWQFIKERIGSGMISRNVRNLYRFIGSTFGLQAGGDPYLSAELINKSAINWIRQTSGPRFMWIHYMDVHTPYYPHEGTVSEDISKRQAVKLFHRVHKQRKDPSEQDLELLRRLYRGEIDYLDRCIGTLLEELDDHLDLDETVLAFGSDHGEAFNEHGFVYHPDGVFYDELVHVPLIMKGPGFPSQHIDTPVSNADLTPTLLRAADISVPDSCVGSDLNQLIEDPPKERLVFTEGHTEIDGEVMVTSGEYKLIYHIGDEKTILYNRNQDPEERENRIDELPEVHKRLRTAIDDHIEMTRDHTGKDNDVSVDDDVKAQLRRLGYAE